MSAERRRRQPRALPGPSPINALIAERVQAALEAPLGSHAAIGNAQEAIFLQLNETMTALKPALAQLLETPDMSDPSVIREQWISKLRFLNGCLCLPDLASLSIALQELGRGVTADSLRPDGNMQGGRAGTEQLRLMAYAVEAADELKRRCTKDAEYRERLKNSETAYSTIHKYRKAIDHVPEFTPRVGWSLHWQEAPEIVLEKVIWAIKTLS